MKVTVDGPRITSADIRLGCCRTRPIWEEIAQAMGPLGDHADGRSLFSQNVVSTERGTRFDEWVLRSLYATPVNADEAALRASLEQARPPLKSS